MIMSGISPDMQNLVKKYNGYVTFCAFPFLSFFLPSFTEKTTEPILTHNGLYDAVSRKEVPFGGYKI